MRRLITPIVLLVVLGGLAGYIYYIDSGPEAPDPNAKPKAFEVASDNIEELQFKSPDGQTARVLRTGGNWELVEPVKADADDGVIGTVTSNLGTLEVQRVVEESPTDLGQYGLTNPRIDVAYRLQGQKEFQRLLVGEKTPTGGDFYAKRGDEKRVILISSFLDSIFTKTPFDLRDKVILKFERDKADGIEVARGASISQFARSGSDWRIVKPAPARADYAATEGLMTRLSSTNMLKVVSETGENLRMYGLDRPSISASVTSGSSRATLLLGQKAPDGGFYAKDSSRPVVFTVEEALATDLGKDIAEFRRKELFDSRPFSANRVEVRRGSETMAFEKRDADGKTTWSTAGQNVDSAKVEELLTKLSTLRADSFQPTAPPSLKMPVAAVTVRFDESKTESVTFGRSGNEVFASRSDEPGAAKVDAVMFDEAIKAVDALK